MNLQCPKKTDLILKLSKHFFVMEIWIVLDTKIKKDPFSSDLRTFT